METPLQAIRRLLTAIETLVAEEEVLLRAGEYAAATAAQDGLQTLIDRVAQLARSSAAAGRIDEALHRRAAEILQRRSQGAELLTMRLAEVRTELRLIAEARQCTTRMKPVYGRGDSATLAPALAASA